jgi:hypothetical protein
VFNLTIYVEIMRAFVQLRQMLASNAELSSKLVALEKKYDIKFKAVFEAIHELMTPSDPRKKRPIGFAPWEKNDGEQGGCHPINCQTTTF